MSISILTFFFFFNDSATTEIYTLSLHDALPICNRLRLDNIIKVTNSLFIFKKSEFHHGKTTGIRISSWKTGISLRRSEEHTSELQSHSDLVCRLLLEKKKKQNKLKKYHSLITDT